MAAVKFSEASGSSLLVDAAICLTELETSSALLKEAEIPQLNSNVMGKTVRS
jgi:LytS/YehU family sensor histidine kinase